jgi:DNA-binding NarL/FixJ family response regulator
VSEGGRYIEQEIAQALALQGRRQRARWRNCPSGSGDLRQLAAGRSLHEIADALGLGYKTIANNCSMIKTRLGVSRTADLLRLALEAGLG